MNSRQVFSIIEEIAATSSKNEKEALVKKASADPLFVRVCEYAYNPFKTYGIQQMPDVIPDGDDADFDDETWMMLDRLIARDLSGDAARVALAEELAGLNDESAALLIRIIRKDLRAGFSESTINKAIKGLIPDFPYMRCCLPKDAKLNEFDWKLGVISQEKADGMFCNLDYEEGGEVRLTSRQGSPFPIEAFQVLAAEVRGRIVAGTQSHGEMLVRKGGEILPREIGNGVLNSVLKGGAFAADEEPVLMLWDQIPLSAVTTKGKHSVPYLKRLSVLASQLKATAGNAIALIETRVHHSLADCYGHYRELLKKGREGTIIKNPHAIWKDGTSKEQVKLKLEADVDLKVVAIVPGRAGTKNEGRAGSLTCETACGQLRVDVTVKNEDMRNRVDTDPDDWIERVITVRANSIMAPSESSDLHSLFLPRMVEADYRTDKSEADTLERVRDQFEAAVKAA